MSIIYIQPVEARTDKSSDSYQRSKSQKSTICVFERFSGITNNKNNKIQRKSMFEIRNPYCVTGYKFECTILSYYLGERDAHPAIRLYNNIFTKRNQNSKSIENCFTSHVGARNHERFHEVINFNEIRFNWYGFVTSFHNSFIDYPIGNGDFHFIHECDQSVDGININENYDYENFHVGENGETRKSN